MAADDFTLIPADDEAVTPDADLDAAAASALAEPGDVAGDEDAPEPFGRTPAFDFAAGRFVRQGGSPAWVTGLDSLKQWCLMALHSARYAHPVFTEDFGHEFPTSTVGTAGPEAVEEADDFFARLRDAWLVHDRIADVQGRGVYDPVAGAVILTDLVVITDEEVELPFPDLRFSTTEN